MSITRTDLLHLDDAVNATRRYLAALTELDDEEVRAPSLLPGWTRGHVISHVARNADALTDVLLGAKAGDVRAMYASQEQRDADVEAGARRSEAELRADSQASADRWLRAARDLTGEEWDARGSRTPGDATWPVRRVVTMRRREVEVHHADLGIGYTAGHWPADLVEELLAERLGELEASGRPLRVELVDSGPAGTAGPTVSGTTADVLWWLLGRGSGQGLACSEGRLPEIGKWR